jgi:excisionase family DNA binding protein
MPSARDPSGSPSGEPFPKYLLCIWKRYRVLCSGGEDILRDLGNGSDGVGSRFRERWTPSPASRKRSVRCARSVMTEPHDEHASLDLDGRGSIERREPPDLRSKLALTYDEAAHAVGVDPRTIRRWVERGLPVCKIGKTARIRPADLDTFLCTHRASEVRAEVDGQDHVVSDIVQRIRRDGMQP